MGGKAFNSVSASHKLNLYTPRMPSSVYHKVLAEVQGKLRTVYAQAESPIEGPGKTDHGDVDVLVLPSNDASRPTAEDIMVLLGAEHYYRTPRARTTHFALPWPEDAATEKELRIEDDDCENTPVDTSQTRRRRRYIQLDLHVCPNQSEFTFTLFLHSHGDLWTLLGTILRPYGLVATPEGLFLRIPELETWNKHRARVKLTTDPDATLRFLGLNVARFHSGPFPTWDSLLDYMSECRFDDDIVVAEPVDCHSKNDLNDHTEPHQQQQPPTDEPSSSPLTHDIRLKAHDRSKAKQRPLFAYYFDTYRPARRRERQLQQQQQQHHQTPPPQLDNNTNTENTSHNHDRTAIIHTAKSFFGPRVAREYDDRRQEGIYLLGATKLWSDVRKTLAPYFAGPEVSVAMRRLKSVVVVGDDNDADDNDRDAGVVLDSEARDQRGGTLADANGRAQTRNVEVRRAYEEGRFDFVRSWIATEWRNILEKEEEEEEEGE